MSFNIPQLEIQGEWEKLTQEVAEAKLVEISDVQKHIQKISQNQDPEIRERLENSWLQDEVLQFISDAASDNLQEESSEYSSSKFDTDGEVWLDNFEFKNFSDALSLAIEQIVILDWIWAFNEIQEDSAYSWWYAPDKKIAEYADFQELFLWDDQWESFSEAALNSLWVSDEELHTMSEKPFDITSADSWWEMWILLSKELWDGVEDILRFMWNIPAGAVLLPRYLSYRLDINSSNPVEATEGEIKIKELVADNPSLWLLDLIWEKWIDMIKQLWSMLVSWKQWDIAMTLVTIAWLLAGWAGAVKLWARATQMSRVERVAGNIQRWAARVDDIVGWAWMWHMMWTFTETPNTVSSSRDIQEIDWNNIHFKDTDESTIPLRYGMRWDNPEMEYKSLESMSEISDKIAKPLWIQRDTNGRMTWYNLEKVTHPYSWDISSITPELKQQIRNEFQKLHENGFAHWDINTQNILLYHPQFPDTSVIDFKIIDPVWFPQNFEHLSQAKVDDMNQLDKILWTEQNIPSLSESFMQWSPVNILWNDGNSYRWKILWVDQNQPWNYIVEFSDGNRYSIESHSIQSTESQIVSGPSSESDIWDIASESLPAMSIQQVLNLFGDVSGEPIYRELTKIVLEWDVSSLVWRQQLKQNLLRTLKNNVDNLWANIDSNTAWLESNQAGLSDLDSSIINQRQSLSILEWERVNLLRRKNELQHNISKNNSGMTELQKSELADLEKQWEWLSHHADSVRAYATLKELWWYEKWWDIATELRHARSELTRAKIEKASQEMILTPEQRALESYNSMRRWKIEAAKDIIRWDIEHYNQVLLNKFPGKEIGDLNLSELQALAQTDITIGMRLAEHRGTDLWPDAVATATKLQNSFRWALWEVYNFESQRASYLNQQVQETQWAYTREVNQAWIQSPITSQNIARLEDRIRALETLETVWSQTLYNISYFHDMLWGEAQLGILTDIRNQIDKSSAWDVAELAEVTNSLWNVTGRIESDSSTLSSDESRRSNLAQDIAVKQNDIENSQQWIDYYTWIWRQVVWLFS